MATVSSKSPTKHFQGLVEQLRQGKAIFSTNLQQYAPQRAELPLAPIILRSDPFEDVQSMVSRLRNKYPQESKKITVPINNIYEYFDHRDVHLHGTNFILGVLSHIGVENVERATRVELFAQHWINNNIDRFCSINEGTQELFNAEEKEQHHESFLQDALERLKIYRANPPAIAQAFLECPRPVNQSMNVQDVSPAASFQTNPSVDRSVSALESSAVLVPSSPTIALSATTQAATRKRRNSARLSSPEYRVPTLPAQQYHSDEEVKMRNNTKLFIQAKDANISSYQAATANFGPVPAHATASVSLPPSRQSTKQELHDSKGQPAMYQGGFPTGAQQPPTAQYYGMNLHQSLSPAMLHDVPHVVSVGDRDFHAQVVYSYPGARGTFPYYGMEPVQQLSRQPPIIGSSPMLLERCYPQCTPSFSQGQQAPQTSQTEIYNYQGYYFGTLSLPKVRHKSQNQDQQPMQASAYQDASRLPFAYTGNDRAHGRLQGKAAGGHNPRKSFSDDARLMRPQEGLDRQELLNNNGQARRTSSAAYYDLNRPQTGVQQNLRGHRRNSIGRGSSRCRSSVDQHTPTAHGQQPSEGSSSHIGSFGGGRRSGEHTGRKVYETIDEDKAERGFRDPSSREVGRGKEDCDSHVTPQGINKHMNAEMTRVPDCTEEPMSMSTRGEAINPLSQATNHSNVQNPSTSCRPALLDPPQVDYNNAASMTDVSGGGPKRPSWAMRPDIDHQKLYVKGQWLQRADIASLFEPYGNILHIARPFKLNGPGIPVGRICFFVHFSHPDEAANALRHLDGLTLNKGGRLSVNYAYSRPETVPDRNGKSSSGSIGQTGQYNAARGFQPNSHKPSEIRYPAAYYSSFSAAQTDPVSDSGYMRHHTTTPQDINEISSDVQQLPQAGVDPITPRKKQKSGAKKAMTPKQVDGASPTYKPSATWLYDPVTEGDFPKDKATDKTPVRSRRATCTKDAQQYPEDPEVSTQSGRKGRHKASEPKPSILAEHLSATGEKQESSTRVEKSSGRVPPCTSDGSPSRKPRNGGMSRQSIATEVISSKSMGHDDNLQEMNVLAGLSVEQWPPLRSIVPTSRTEQNISEAQVSVPRTPSRKSAGQNTVTTVKDDAAISGSRDIEETLSDRIIQAGQEREGSTTPRPKEGYAGPPVQTMSIDATTRENVEALKVEEGPKIASKNNDASAATTEAALEPQNAHGPIIIAGGMPVDLPKPDVGPNIGRDESMNKALESNSEADLPEDTASANDSRTQSSAGGFELTTPPSYSHTERSESWAEECERHERDKDETDRAKVSKSSKSAVAIDLLRVSELLGAPKHEKNEEAPLRWRMVSWRKTAKALETTASPSNTGGNAPTAIPDLNIERVRPLTGFNEEQGRANPLSSEGAEAVAKAAVANIGAQFDCILTKEASSPTQQLEDDTRVKTENLVVPTGRQGQEAPKGEPTEVTERSMTMTVTGKRKDLRINVPPRTPSPTSTIIPASTLSSSPKTVKRKDRFELPLRNSSLPEPSPPISTHMKKKKGVTPTGKTNRKESGTRKSKEKTGDEPQNFKAIETEARNLVPVSQTGQAIKIPLDVDITSGTSHESSQISRNKLPQGDTQATVGSEIEAVLSKGVVTEHDETKVIDHNKPDVFVPGQAEESVPRFTYPAPDPGSAVLILEDLTKRVMPRVEGPNHDKSNSTGTKSRAPSPETAQNEISHPTAKKSKNKKASKARAKAKRQASSASDSAMQPLPAPKLAAFPTLPFDSPEYQSQDTVIEGEMFPPLPNPLPSNASPTIALSASRSQFTSEWTRQAIETAMEVQNGRPPPIPADVEQFDQGRSEYQKQKALYDVYKFEKLGRLAKKGLGINLAFESVAKRRKTSPATSDVEDSSPTPNLSSFVYNVESPPHVAGSPVVWPHPKVVLPYIPDDKFRILNSSFKPIVSDDESDPSVTELVKANNKPDSQSVMEDTIGSPMTSIEDAFVADATISAASTARQSLSLISEPESSTEQDIFSKPIKISKQSVVKVAEASDFDAMSTLNTISEAMKIFQARFPDNPEDTPSNSLMALTELSGDKSLISVADIEAGTLEAESLSTGENILSDIHKPQSASLEVVEEPRSTTPEAEHVNSNLVASAVDTGAELLEAGTAAGVEKSSSSPFIIQPGLLNRDVLASTIVHEAKIPELGTAVNVEKEPLDPSPVSIISSTTGKLARTMMVPAADFTEDNSGSSFAIPCSEVPKSLPTPLSKIDIPTTAPPISSSSTSQNNNPLIVTQADFPALAPGKPAFAAAPASTLTFPFARPMAPPSRLSEANVAAISKDPACPEPHNEPRLRRHTSAISSEYSTTSSARRKLFSETMSPRLIERGSKGGQFASGESEKEMEVRAKRRRGRAERKEGELRQGKEEVWALPRGSKAWTSGEE